MFKLLKKFLAFVTAVIEILLILRFVLKILAANTTTPFVDLIYAASRPFIQPFLFIFPTPSIRGGYVIEFTTLFAIFAYAFAEYLLQQFLSLFLTNARTESSDDSDEAEKGN